MILVNFKSYLEASGPSAVVRATEAEEVSRETGVTIAVAPQFVDIHELVKRVSIPVFAQHIDSFSPGANTGSVLPEAIKLAGARGTIVNHSERRLKFSEIKNSIRRAREVGLEQVVCADTAQACAEVAALDPNMVAIEPPELIGTGVAVSKAKPEVVRDAVARIHEINPKITILCGAGISSGEDIAAALRLGTQGVLVASGVIKAPNPKTALRELALAAKGFSRIAGSN